MTVLLELLAAAAEDLGDLKRPFALGRGRPGPPSSDCYVPNRGTSSVSTDEGSPYRQVQRRARKVDMSPSRVHELLGQAAGCETTLKRAVTLPAELFTDPEWFDAERRVIHRNWVAVCRTADVTAEAQYVAVDVAGEPVVVIRGRDGVLRAMSNVCRHRSMTIVEGSGSISSLCCPYHQWTYRHDGTLINAPSMEQAEDFDVNDVCLPEFTVDEWCGWVLVAIDPVPQRPADSSPHLSALLAEHRVEEMVRVDSLTYPSPWNWKISIENFLES